MVRAHHKVVPKLLRDTIPEAKLATRAPELAPLTLHQLLHWAGIATLAAASLAAMIYVAWLASGIGRPMRVSWRVEHRVQGRLVIARVRTPIG